MQKKKHLTEAGLLEFHGNMELNKLKWDGLMGRFYHYLNDLDRQWKHYEKPWQSLQLQFLP